MSRLSDYSKFDHIDSGSDEEAPERIPPQAVTPPAAASPQPQEPPLAFRRITNSNRFVLEYGDRSIYEWEQSLNDVTLYITTPPFVRQSSEVVCVISPQQLQVGNLVDNQVHYFINEATAGNVEVESSTWIWEKSTNGGLLTIELQKAQKGVVWEAACLGPPPKNVRLNAVQLEEERQRLLLERWQEENPGMDFRDAKFNGQAPDPRSFMGGVSYG